MNKRLSIVLKYYNNEQGFVIPIALGLGLAIVLIAATLILRSQADQVSAISQKTTGQGLSAAETGVTRYQSIINSNRLSATYPDCVTRNPTNGNCQDTGTTQSWANATAISGVTSCSGGNVSAVQNASTTAWQDIGSNQGQYKLISYVYPAPGTSGTVGVAPGFGQLTVEGRVQQVGSGNSASNTVGTSTTQLQVNIPVQQGNLNNLPVPGLWLSSGGMPGNQTVQGNIYLNDCSVSISPTSYQDINSATNQPYIDSNTGQIYKTIQTGVQFPSLPTKPPSGQYYTISSGSTLTLPRTNDQPASVILNGQTTQVYQYYSSGDLSGSITVTPGARVNIYLDGSIPKGTTIVHECTGNSNCKPTDFQIFGYSTTGTMCLNGNNHIEAFIFAPSYGAGVDGGGNSGGFFGSLWVNNFGNVHSCSSNSNHTIVFQSADWNSLGLTPLYLSPTISPASLWQRQPAS